MTCLGIEGCLQTLQGFCDKPVAEWHDLQRAGQGQVDGLNPQISMAQERERLRRPEQKGRRPLQSQADAVITTCTQPRSLSMHKPRSFSMQRHSQHHAVMQTDQLSKLRMLVTLRPWDTSWRTPLQKACESKPEGPC